MKVSIIVPVFNVSCYIVKCLESISVQTYQDIECILVDDCGQDDSIEKAEHFISHYTGKITFMIIHHSENQGLSGSRNTGIKAAKGEYIYFLDSDDAITPDCIETFIILAKKYPHAEFIQGNIIHNDGTISPYAFDEKIPQYCDDKDYLEKIMLQYVVTSSCNRFIKLAFIHQYQLYFPKGLLHEDMYWVYFLAKYTRAAAFTTKGTYIYNIREDSIMTSVTKDMHIKRLKSRLHASKAYYQDLTENRPTSAPRRIYLCVNLFSCLTELNGLSSMKHWIVFWSKIIRIASLNIRSATWYRFAFLIILLPPICFFSRNAKFSWRIQQRIISHI